MNMNKKYLILGLIILLSACSHKVVNNKSSEEISPQTTVKMESRPYVIGSLKDSHHTAHTTYSVKEIDLPQNKFDIHRI